MNEKKLEVAQWVRDAIASVPPLDGFQFEVNTPSIYADQVAGQTYWRVPMIVTPEPRRLTAIHEYLAEVEGVLQDERSLDILLFVGAPMEAETLTTAAK